MTRRWIIWFTLCQCLYGLNIVVLIFAGFATRNKGVISVAIYMVDSVVIDLLAIPIIIYGFSIRFGAYGKIAAENDDLAISGAFMIYKNIQQVIFILLCGISDATISIAIVLLLKAKPELNDIEGGWD